MNRGTSATSNRLVRTSIIEKLDLSKYLKEEKELAMGIAGDSSVTPQRLG